MILSSEQSKALDTISKWLKNTDTSWMFKLGGYAGTGKTFLLQYLINLQSSHTVCCAPTGKAASVLESKLTNMKVTTIHKLLYAPIQPDDKEIKRLQNLVVKNPTNTNYIKQLNVAQTEFDNSEVKFCLKYDHKLLRNKLIIVDESSMVSNKMMIDMKSTGCKVLFVGDPGQLPPVKSKEWFSGNFDFILKKIQRQSADNPIIRLSSDIRQGSLKISNYQYNFCKILPKRRIKKSELISCNQILTGTNMTRVMLNKIVRDKLNYNSELPVIGDKLICLKNEDLFINTYTNGVQAIASSNSLEQSNKIKISISYEGSNHKNVVISDHNFRNTYLKTCIKPKWYELLDSRQFDYAYAITVHKSQGSEWDDVIVIDDGIMSFNDDYRKRWLYTAVTRAKKTLILSTQ